jgi:transposase
MAVGKFTEQEKYDVVQKYLSGYYSFSDLGKQIGIDKRAIRFWVALYNRHGRKALTPRDNFTAFDLSFKMDVLNYRRRMQASYFDTAVEFNLGSPSTVHKWEEQILLKDMGAYFKLEKGRTSMTKKKPETMSQKELLDELKYLRMENAYLKKLDALVQQKKDLQMKTGQRRSKN